MLENIKSKYLFKKLFSNVEEIIKLKIAKYNKRLQNIVDVNLINYKTFTNKYIIYEEDSKIIKEYKYGFDEDFLIYEGGYSNRKRNDKGKEYGEKGNIIYEGEYSNGKRNGKGKEYNEKGKLIYEGEYLSGKRSGKAKEYYSFGKIMFEGEYLNGKRNGPGKEYHPNGKLNFIGE